MNTYTNNCNTQHLYDHHHSLLNRIWSHLMNTTKGTKITDDYVIKQATLTKQKEVELQNQTRRNTDIHRMVMRSVL